ncbi:Hypothetical protein I595_3585 [Croceitalea dokdonensis DOKDO 023]|uniref:Uncharacterized protein n=1 Tax=Croceitalea dokdonensis DOKDO 023 TaxID=1300341 RepID=A0A0P7AR71_9FLAO|nr:hypothetical protein [Croceitalea dokdonensis]KPM30288.1 Hypothetical protein I595_3585 [Croceitalea dokdonensis DOKDO 023]
MKHIFYFLALSVFTNVVLNAQVKIGENPQTISPGSLLELESTERSLVITRVTAEQMQALPALQGAMVFNTDEGCVFHFDGSSWQNLCANTTNIDFTIDENSLVLVDSDGTEFRVDLGEAISQTFSNLPIENFRETIIITQEGSNYNFEVGEITGENIADNTLQGVDLASASITQDKLAPLSVGQINLQENAVSDFQIDYTEVTLSDFINDAGFITANQVLSPEPNNALIDNNGVFYDEGPLQNLISQNTQEITDHISADGDLDATNEIQDATEVAITAITGNAGTNVQSALEDIQADLDNLNAGGGNTDAQNLSTNNNPGNITIDNGNTITLNVEDGDANDQNEIQDAAEVDIAPITGITGSNVQLALEELQTDVDGLVAGGGADGNDFITGGTLNGELLELTGPGAAGAVVDLSDFALDTDLTSFLTTELDADPTNELQLITSADNSVTINQVGNNFDLSVTTIADGNDFITGGTLAGESLELSGTGLASASIDLSNFALDTDIFSLPDDSAAVNGDVLITDGTGNYSWATVAGGGTDTNNFITTGNLNGDILELTGNGGGAGATVDLSDLALDTEMAIAIAASAALDLDIDPNNEIELPDDATATAGQILATNADGTYSWVDDQTSTATIVSADADQILTTGTDTGALLTNANIDATFATDAELATAVAASAALDLDIDPNNEIELPDDATATAGQILATNADGTYSWVDDQTSTATIVSADADQILTTGTDTGALLTNANIDATFATDAELATAVAASAALDLDIDPNNEIELPDDATATAGQILATNADGTYSWVDDQTSTATIVSADADQILTTGTDTGALLTNANIDATFATDTELATAVAAQANTNFATDNLILNGARTHDLSGNNLVFNGSGNVGIGNLPGTPQDKLDVAGQVRARNGFAATGGTVGQPSYGFYTDDDADTGMFRVAADEIGFSVGGDLALKITEDSDDTNVIVTGAFSTPIRTESGGGTITIGISDHTVIITNAANVNIPAPSNIPTSFNAGQIYVLKNMTVNTLTLSVQYIPSQAPFNPTVSIPAGTTLQLQSDGTTWHQIN